MNEVIGHFGAKGVVDLVLLLLNGTIAAAIFMRVLFARPAIDPSPPWHIGPARFCLAAAYVVMAYRIFAGSYNTPVEPTEVLANAGVLWIAWLVRGDMSLLVRTVRALQARAKGDQ